MMDKQKVAEVILSVLQRGALVAEDKRELYMSALLAGFDEVDRQERVATASKLYGALNTIKEHCEGREASCKDCPLSTDIAYGGCDFLDNCPTDWDLGFLKGDTDGKE